MLFIEQMMGMGIEGCGMDYRKIIREQFLPFLIIGIVGMGMLARSFYSFSWSDESFYLTLVHRFWLGEKIIADEWFPSQLGAPLMLPFYSLFQWITGGNDGVYFYFRVVYLAISMVTAVTAFCIIRKKNSVFPSLMCTLLYFLYSRANIGGMSYYNMTLTWVLLAVLMFYAMPGNLMFRHIRLYLAGIFLAFAVVNTPFLAVIYIVTGALVLTVRKYRTCRRDAARVFTGTALAAAVYLGYVFYHVSFQEIIANIPYILNEPERQKTNLFMAVPVILMRIAWRYVWTIGIIGCEYIYLWFKKHKKEGLTERQLKSLVLVGFLAFNINSYLSRNLIGCINIAGTLFLVMFLYAFGEKKMEKGVPLFGMAGAGMVLAFTFSSDTGLDAMAIGFVLIAIEMILQVAGLPAFKNRKLFKGVVLAVVSVMVIQTGVLRMASVYRDAPLWQLDTQIMEGPAKYLYTTKEHAYQYEELRYAIEEYVREEDRVFYSKSCFWTYLCTENAYGTPSSWRLPFNSPRLEEYFKMKPEKMPTCIFVVSPSYGSYESSLIQGNEKEDFPNLNKEEGFLYQYVIKNDYEKIVLDCANIYRCRRV